MTATKKFTLKLGDKVLIQVDGVTTHVEQLDAELVNYQGQYAFRSLTKGSESKYYSPIGAHVIRRL